MNTFSIESWCKPVGADKSEPMGIIHFHVSDEAHLAMERAEEQLVNSANQRETDISADMETLELELPEECDALSDPQFHVYVTKKSGEARGQFFLMGHRAKDGALVYSNSVMVDQLG
ncbi:hypothetical protein [Marinobacterium arenosum]|uniref:hypothetical protein n=1 Tax=Marinobacterium arenosum TaxID=2862496 RepID=UPI001C947A01|nr:hypothetical protein [Marinobacterium arenosum]MBY4677754.1 hypothetical protein [Marinobacterium arenosum]